MWTGPYGDLGSRKYLLASLDQSLERLGLDYVDIFYHHHMDPSTPLEETMGALATAVNSGKALYVGLSNYDGPTLEKATAILDELHVPFIINQNRYNIFDRTVERNGLKETAHQVLARASSLSRRSPRDCSTNRYLNGVPADSRIAHDGRFLQRERVDAGTASADSRPERSGRRARTDARRNGAGLAAARRSWWPPCWSERPAHSSCSTTSARLRNTSFSDDELRRIDKISL